jgi:2-iminoacetate synthase
MSGVKTRLCEYDGFDFDAFFGRLSLKDVDRVLDKARLSPEDYLILLSPVAVERLEEMARRAQTETSRHFGRTIQMFAPLYVSDYCVNTCVYCGFNKTNEFSRRQLSMEEVDKEARIISDTGIKHILLLTGEHPEKTTLSYIADCVRVLKRYFSSISIEVYALTEEQYKVLVDAGVDGMTMYQEVYREDIYRALHPSGPKRDYAFRLDAPERACRAGMRTVTIGALLGLAPWRQEAFFTGLHAAYLQSRYPSVEQQIAPPRLRPCSGRFQTASPVNDVDLVQYILAYRIFMPHSGIGLSTRERGELRDRLINLGITRMSAGVSTAVGGYSKENREGQFEPADGRSVEEIRSMLKASGYQPVFQDWYYLF